ncbi:hypothetical protein TEA_000701 [Camellia sinensis var. sinensis]|uniref:Uncharacterized protein n=1 Tax=Camellia sinensis var. sinensis TaxID=542762 RepID=A0A4V6RY56_CAMSN|nr:hypothetical protein TEA_000701 [Camellia sinensis var. sinensis]
MWMSVLPEELWRRILEIGVVETPNLLNFKDLCCLSPNFDTHFPPPPHLTSSSTTTTHLSIPLPKTSTKSEKARKLAAHHRAVLRIESQIAEHSRKLQEIQLRSVEETEKMKATGAELSNLRKVRQASVALNVWQPEVVRGRHKQIVEQCVVPADSRIHALEMELRLCKQHITGLDKAYVSEIPKYMPLGFILGFDGKWYKIFMMFIYVTWQRDEKRRLDAAKEQLASVKYHPLRDYSSTSGRVDECCIKRKKLKKEHINFLPAPSPSLFQICVSAKWNPELYSKLLLVFQRFIIMLALFNTLDPMT